MLNEAQVVMKIKMWNTKLYSSQFLCSTEKNLPLKTTDSDADVMFWFYLEHGQDAWNYTAAASQYKLFAHLSQLTGLNPFCADAARLQRQHRHLGS